LLVAYRETQIQKVTANRARATGMNTRQGIQLVRPAEEAQGAAYALPRRSTLKANAA